MKIKLNLIPPAKREEIEKAKKVRTVLRWEFGLVFIMVIFLAMLFSISYILQINLNMAENNAGLNGQDVERIKQISDFDAQIKKINVKMSEILKIQSGQLYWTNFFEKLNSSVPVEIIITSIATDNYKAAVSGKARDRDILITFKENLEKSGCFDEVNLPLSSLVARENVDFSIALTIKKECLKK
ncbi:MAG: PilN domain-containing protein [Parcubacteria group bacterium]